MTEIVSPTCPHAESAGVVTYMVGLVLSDRVERVRRRREIAINVVLLPAMKTDIETVLDVVDVVGARMQSSVGADETGAPYAIQERYQVTSGQVWRHQLVDMNVHERNSLVANVQVNDRQMQLLCEAGMLEVSSSNPNNFPNAEQVELERLAVRTLLQGSSRRPSWRRISKWGPLAAVALLVAATVWLLIATTPPHPAVIVAAVIGLGFAGGAAYDWYRRLKTAYQWTAGPITFRAQSRQDLYAARADRLANLKVALITAPVSIVVALLVAWMTGFIS